MSLEDLIRKQAEKQLDKATSAVRDGEWFDSLVNKIATALNESEMDNDQKAETLDALQSLAKNRDQVAGLGADALTLLMLQLAAGRPKDATSTYLQAHGSVEAIIEAMNRGTAGLIEAKKQLDKWQADAVAVIKDIAIKGAKLLLPLLLTAI